MLTLFSAVIKQQAMCLLWTHWVAVCHSFDLLMVLCPGQQLQSFRVKFATRWIQRTPVCSAEIRPEGVHCDDEGTPVCLKLKHIHSIFSKNKSYVVKT